MAEKKPQLLFVHGIGKPLVTETETRKWLLALAQGARGAGHPEAVSGLTQSWLADVRFANYSDVFHSAGSQGDDGIGDEDVPFLSALLAELVDEAGLHAAERDDARSLRVVEDTRAELAASAGAEGEQGLLEPVRRLAGAATTLLQLPGLRRAAQWSSGQAFLRNLAQVGRYLARQEKDDAERTLDTRVRDRLLTGLDPDRPLVVVAHSLGTVVAYEALHTYQGPVPLWVTLGSPLATGAVVMQRLVPRPNRTPECVGRWLNFWDRDDVVTGRPRVEKWTLPNSHGVRPVSARVDSDGLWTHTATKYLAQEKVAGPVVAALTR
jgi:pimeloyl-ACP methyl ester carboxylesterase